MEESKLPKYNENNIVKDDKNIIYRIKNQLILDGLNSIKSVDTTLDEICIGTILSEEDNNENMNLLPDAVSHMIKNIRITINGWYADIEIMNTAIGRLFLDVFKSEDLDFYIKPNITGLLLTFNIIYKPVKKD
jgi:hypothetical protein